MKKLIMLMAIFISACTLNMNNKLPDSQTYKIKGASHDISITGRAELDEDLIQDLSIIILFDGAQMIKGVMESNYKGAATELPGSRYEGKDTIAVCHTNFNASAKIKVECIVYIGDQKTVTLTLIPTMVN
ncbi:hypothetical protein [Methyloradius palustris]|uniref:Lipoprotein n=1 Tax=Methyloradius palustris TaxID=2778876 RepID=A0A8D5GFN3_9PROT|nr:hypothetical protein [Methyloradius palustris]BCM25869.1 hypothetical protein ZMTM_21280 [Methyloradius palustris]